MKKSKILAAALCGAMLLSFASCNKGTTSSTGAASTDAASSGTEVKSDLSEPGTLPIWQGEGTPEIKILMAKSDYVTDYENNEYTKWIEENCNVKLSFDFLPQAETDTRVNLLFTSGSKSDLPDVLVRNLSLASAKQYYDAGTLVDMTDYYAKGDCVNTDKADKEYPNYNIKGNITSADGKIYSIPKLQASPSNEVKYKMWVNQHWLDNLGIKLEDVKTTDDFRNMLEKFKTGDPNGNGAADELPFNTPASSWGGTPYKFLTNAFVFEGDGDMLMLQDGKVTVSYVQDGWFEAADYIKGLVSDGLITKESFTQNQEAVVTYMKSNPDTVGAITNSSLGGWGGGDLLLTEKDADGNTKKDADGKTVYVKDEQGNYVVDTSNLREPYSVLSPLKGPKGVQYASYAASSTTGMWTVTTAAANPELCVRVGDFQFSEEGFLLGRFGVENVHWQTKDEYLKANPGVELTARYGAMGYEGKYVFYNDVFGTNNNLAWYDQMPYFSGSVEAEGMFVSKNSDGVPMNLSNNATVRQETATGVYQNYKPDSSVYCPNLHFTDEENETISTIKTELTKFVGEERVAYYLGQDCKLNSGKDAFLAELKTIGLDQFLEICQTAYDRQYK